MRDMYHSGHPGKAKKEENKLALIMRNDRYNIMSDREERKREKTKNQFSGCSNKNV